MKNIEEKKKEKKNDPNRIPVDNFGPYPGYWTELIILNNWPPDWKPENHDDPRPSNADLSVRQTMDSTKIRQES